MKFLSLTVLFTALITLTACSSNKKNQSSNPITSYTDSEIANLVTSVNKSEIEMAEMVVNKGENEEVKEYAREMIEDHRSNNKKTKAIMVEADLDFSDNSMKGRTLQAMAEVDKKQLANMEGKAIDKEYIKDQVETHKTVLKDLRETLIPQAKNEDLKAHLEETAKTIEDHLEHAQKLERKFL